jgi:hypothetical protein
LPVEVLFRGRHPRIPEVHPRNVPTVRPEADFRHRCGPDLWDASSCGIGNKATVAPPPDPPSPARSPTAERSAAAAPRRPPAADQRPVLHRDHPPNLSGRPRFQPSLRPQFRASSTVARGSVSARRVDSRIPIRNTPSSRLQGGRALNAVVQPGPAPGPLLRAVPDPLPPAQHHRWAGRGLHRFSATSRSGPCRLGIEKAGVVTVRVPLFCPAGSHSPDTPTSDAKPSLANAPLAGGECPSRPDLPRRARVARCGIRGGSRHARNRSDARKVDAMGGQRGRRDDRDRGREQLRHGR